MRAIDILHTRLTGAMGFMHKARWRALWRTVQALLIGERLWLTSLGRSLPGKAARKHAIKAVDRLLGSNLLHAERTAIYASMTQLLLVKKARPVMLLDTTKLREGAFALVASLAYEGRSIPIYSMVIDVMKPRIPVGRQFFDCLASILPVGCRPIIVGDAGFESPWFTELERRSWDYVGRVRNNTRFEIAGRWVHHSELHRRASRRAQNLGYMRFPKSRPHARRMVLSKRPIKSYRQRPASKTPARDRIRQKRAKDPWLLVTSLSCRPSVVVDIYAMRMQIEQNFRDAKNHRWGWSLSDARSRSFERLELLLLVASLAYFVRIVCGVAAEKLGLHRRHQANTERRRVLSIFVLGGFVLRTDECRRFTKTVLFKALRSIKDHASHPASGA